MSQTVSVLTEVTGSSTPSQVTRLDLPGPRVKLRDLIALQVRAELAQLAARSPKSVVVPPLPVVLPEAQVDRALLAFSAGRLFAVVDGRQIPSLDAELEIGPESEIRFVRLMPLVGG